MRFTSWLAAAGSGLLAACGSSPAADPPAGGSQPAALAGTAPLATHAAPARSWDEYKLRAARRIQATSAGEMSNGPLPDPLQSIPVLQVQLNRDGTVRDVVVLRTPRQSPETVEMARRAIRRAAPFEPVGQLPRPWQFSETFLYDEQLKFQLRTLVEAP